MIAIKICTFLDSHGESRSFSANRKQTRVADTLQLSVFSYQDFELVRKVHGLDMVYRLRVVLVLVLRGRLTMVSVGAANLGV